VGWLSVVIGILGLLVEADRITGAPDLAYVLFHAALVAGGLALLGAPWLGRHARAAGWVTAAVVAAAGLLVSAVPATTTLCCVSGSGERHGFPFTFLARRGGAGGWRVDGEHLVADVLFWAYAGLLALVVVALLRRLTAGRATAEVRTAHPHPEPRTHAGQARVRQPGPGAARAGHARGTAGEQPADD
jgi:hypothetical protein